MNRRHLLKKPVMKAISMLSVLLAVGFFLYSTVVFATASWTDTTSGTRTWTGLATSTNGAVIIAADSSSSSANLYKSTDGGVTWSAITNGGSAYQKQWKHVACSSDCSTILASELSGNLYLSTDGGSNWTTASGASTGSWTGVAVSSNGSILAAIANTGASNHDFWVSTNSGSSWSDPGGVLDLKTPNALGMSSDGTKLVVGMFGGDGDIWTSGNSGTNWTEQNGTGAGNGFWSSVGISGDGTKIMGTLSFGGDVFAATPASFSSVTNTWVDLTSSVLPTGGGLWKSISLSNDGSSIIVSASSGAVTTSTGNSTVNATWLSNINSSSDWHAQTNPPLSGTQPGVGSWTKAIISSDGTYMVIAGNTTDVWTFGSPITVAPTVTTQAASSITTTTATFNGNITATGNANPTIRGFNYGLTTGYGTTISTSGSYSTGAYTGGVTGLVCNTTYHYRGFATNTAGTGNGGDQSFTTSACPTVPVVTSGSSSGITFGYAIGAGNITSTGGENASSRYVEFGLTTGYGSQSLADSGSFSTGTFSEGMHGLNPGTLYHWRACATNTAGNGCGSDQTFTTLATPGAPTGLSGTAGFTQITLNWTAPSAGDYPISDYIVEYKLTSGSTWYALSHTASTATSAIVPSLTNGTSYDFRVYAMSSAGAGSVSGTTSATPSSTLTVANAPTGLTATTGNAQVALSWTAPVNNGGSAISDYTIQYKTISAGSYSTFSHGASTATSITVTGLTNGTDYNFKVSAVNSVGTGATSSVATAPSATAIYYHILGTGQSLSEGVNSTPALSTTQPYSNKSLTNTPDGGLSSPLIPLVETVNSRESPASGMANFLSAALAGTPTFVVGIHGQGGQAWSSIKKGGTGTAYANGQTQATVTKAQSEAAGAFYKPIGVTITHGETDQINGVSTSTFEGFMQQGQIDYEGDLNALTGLSGTMPFFETQMNSNSVGFVAVAQFLAHKDYPGKIIMVGPKYQLPYFSDHLHLSNTGSKFLGELYAKVIKKVVFDGQTWNPLMPTSVTNVANVVTVSYAIPTGTLAVDTTTVAARTNKGFEFTQTGGSAITISSVALDGSSKKVIITLSGTPDGTNPHIRYAWTCANHPNDNAFGTCGDPTDSGAVGGNIRDTDSSVSPSSAGTGLALYDWSVAFDEAITSPTVPNVPTSLSATLGNTQASLSWTAPVADGGANLSDYYIEYKTAAASSWSTFAHGASTTTSATVTGLTNGTDYEFRVSAVSANGTGGPSNTVYAEPATTPGSPTAPGATGGALQVAVNWTAPASDGGALVTDYLVEYKRTADSSWTTFSHTLSNATAITVTGLLAGTSYDFRISSINVIGTSSVSSTATASTNAASVPGAPTGLGATPGNTQVALSWTAPSSNGGASITDYLVEFRITGGGSFGTFVDGVSASTSATVTGLTNGTSYDFRVSAINSAGTGTPSSTVVSTPATTPGAPTALAGTAGNAQVSLSWTAPASNGGASVTDYLVEFRITGGGSFATFVDGVSALVSATVTGLVNGTGYDFRVSAINSAGTGTASGTTSVTPIAPPVVAGGQTSGPLGLLVVPPQRPADGGAPVQKNTPTPPTLFSRALKVGSAGIDVKTLQQFLNAHGFTVAKSGAGSKGNETTKFGTATKNALIKFQNKYAKEVLTPAGLKKGTGIFGSSTASFVNTMIVNGK